MFRLRARISPQKRRNGNKEQVHAVPIGELKAQQKNAVDNRRLINIPRPQNDQQGHHGIFDGRSFLKAVNGTAVQQIETYIRQVPFRPAYLRCQKMLCKVEKLQHFQKGREKFDAKIILCTGIPSSAIEMFDVSLNRPSPDAAVQGARPSPFLLYHGWNRFFNGRETWRGTRGAFQRRQALHGLHGFLHPHVLRKKRPSRLYFHRQEGRIYCLLGQSP